MSLLFYRVTIQVVSNLPLTSKLKFSFCMRPMYWVTQQVGSNLPLTSKQKFRFSLTCPDLARPKQNVWFDVNRRFESTRCVTLY